MTVRFAAALEPFLVPIDSVKPHPDNPNNGNDDVVMESIIENGFVTLCTADTNTGYMVAGHTRQRALRKLGATRIPVLWEDQWKGDGAKRYLVGDNASAAKAEMDHEQLIKLLGELAETERGLAGTAVTDSDYQKMLLDFANQVDDTDIAGFGRPAIALHGIHQVVIEFQDDPDERDRVFAILAEQYPNIRTVDL